MSVMVPAPRRGKGRIKPEKAGQTGAYDVKEVKSQSLAVNDGTANYVLVCKK